MYMTPSHLKARIIQMGTTQERVALALGIDPSLLGRYLRGIRPMLEGFEARVNSTLDKLEAAEKAATEGRERVMRGCRERAHAGAVEHRSGCWT